MSKTHILFIIIFLVIFGFKAIKDAQPISKSIEIAGDYVTIRYGNALIKAKLQPEAKASFWVNNGFVDKKRSDGWFWVIPLEQAEAMKVSYGDFVHCNSPGASAARGNLQILRVFTAEPKVREKIKEVIKSSLNSPIIEIRGSKLEIKEHIIGTKEHFESYQNKPENFVYIGPLEVYYLIKEIDIVQEHYQ